jgi:hypothetical protein
MSGKRGSSRIKFKALARRFKGFSIPIVGGGVSWEPPPDEREIVRRLITFLEDRRVLYVAYHIEVVDHVIYSLSQTREELTKALQALPESSDAAPALRAMRVQCRKFLDEQRPNFRSVHPRRPSHEGDPEFFVALGELRAIFGMHLATLAYRYKIDVEPELAAIMPPETDGDKE